VKEGAGGGGRGVPESALVWAGALSDEEAERVLDSLRPWGVSQSLVWSVSVFNSLFHTGVMS
jgi:hypothetical protein